MVTTLSARVLGQRIRQMRTRRGLTQQDLAGQDYSKSYISAIEQGKTRPSLEALQRMASRLEVPAGTLLDPDAPGFAPFDPESMPRRVRRRRGVRAGMGGPSLNDPTYLDLRLAEAEGHIYQESYAAAMDILRTLLPEEGGTNNIARNLDSAQLVRAYFLAARVLLEQGATTDALGYLQKGIQLALRQGDTETVERMRNTLGLAYYRADQPLSALEQHKQCLDAVQAGLVADPNFKLQVYSNIANDYWALHDNEKAVATYKSALDMIGEVNSIGKQANIFWEAVSRHTNGGQYGQAGSNAVKALSLFEALDNMRLAANMGSRYGDMLLEMEDYDAAEGYLNNSLGLADSLNSGVDKAQVLVNLARVSMRRGDFDAARDRGEQAVSMAREAVGAKTPRSGSVLARSLALAGEVAVQSGDAKRGDELFGEAIKLAESGGAGEDASDIYQRYAQVLAAGGKHEQASRYYEMAYKAATMRRR
jgi:tetratricopeptide (TPR) repeat protein/DNA-binding XRE family transcriptional regulator